MRPYPLDDEVVRDALYAVTHVVYTLNDYGTYKLSKAWLPKEFAFIRDNVGTAIAMKDPELLGELLDSLKAFGLPDNHPLIRRGTKYLLAQQNQDGSWGDPNDENIRRRCHTAWTVIDGLRSYTERGERLSVPGIQQILEQ
jgi:squalene cyclase